MFKKNKFFSNRIYISKPEITTASKMILADALTFVGILLNVSKMLGQNIVKFSKNNLNQLFAMNQTIAKCFKKVKNVSTDDVT